MKTHKKIQKVKKYPLLFSFFILFLMSSNLFLTSFNYIPPQPIIDKSLECISSSKHNSLPQVSQSFNNLNTTITLNQTAYFPNTDVNYTIQLTNNFSVPLTNINFTSLLDQNLTLKEGNLNFSQTSLAVNESLSTSIICTVPASAPSLDLVFIIDGSGSMSEEINEVKTKVLNLIDQLLLEINQVRIAFIIFGCTLYSENPYDDLRNILDFTNNSTMIEEFLYPFYASGGWEPWGDALQYMDLLSWESSIRLAILITDEPCNYGQYIGSPPSMEYYNGEELYNLVSQLEEEGIIINTMECHGAIELLTSQLSQIAEKTHGVSIELTQNSSTLISQALQICQDAIKEYGLKIISTISAMLDTDVLNQNTTTWILIDNKPPSIIPLISPVYFNENGEFWIQYRLNAKIYDLSGISNVTLFYKYNQTSSYNTEPMNYTGFGIYTFLYPKLQENTLISYYLNVSDSLNNSLETSIQNYTITFNIQQIYINQHESLSLGVGESLLNQFNVDIRDDYALVIKTSGTSFGNLLTIGDLNLSVDFIFNHSNPLLIIPLNNFTGTGFITLKNNGVGYLSAQIQICRTISVNLSQNVSYSNYLDVDPYNNVLLFEIYLDPAIDTYFHCIVNNFYDDFLFYDLFLFNQSKLLKTQTFKAITGQISEPGLYYFLVSSPLIYNALRDIQILISYGYYDDTPYWSITYAPSAAIYGYDLWFILAILSIGIILLKNRVKFLIYR